MLVSSFVIVFAWMILLLIMIVFGVDEDTYKIVGMGIPFTLMFFFFYIKFIAPIKRERALRRYFEEMGYKFPIRPEPEAKRVLDQSPLKKKGTKSELKDCIRATKKNQIIYNAFARVGPNLADLATRDHYFVCITPLDLKIKGTVFVEHEKKKDKLAAAVGKDNLNFESKEFSDHYLIKAEPEKLGYRFFHPRMIELFLEEKQFRFFLCKEGMMLWTPTGMMPRHLLKDALEPDHPYINFIEDSQEMMAKILRNLPKYLIQGYIVDSFEEFDPVKVVCPLCEKVFKIKPGKKSIKCPSCGVEGEL